MILKDELDFTVKMEYVRTPGFHFRSSSKTGVKIYQTENVMRELAGTLTDDDQLVQFYVYPNNDLEFDDDD